MIATSLLAAACGAHPTATPAAPLPDRTAMCTAALRHAGVTDSALSASGQTSYTVPAGPTPPLQGANLLAIRSALSSAVGLPLAALGGQSLALLDFESPTTEAARSKAATDRTPRALGYQCAVDRAGHVVGLWAISDPTLEPGGLLAADGRTLAQIEGTSSTFDALVRVTGYDAAGDGGLPSDGTPLEAVVRALGRLSEDKDAGPLAPFPHMAHLVPLEVAGGCALPDGEVALGMQLWPDSAKPLQTADLAGNGSEFLEWSLRRSGPGEAWTLTALGTGGGCSGAASPLPAADLVTPYSGSVGSAAVAATAQFYRSDCTAAYAMLAGQMLHDAGSVSAYCAHSKMGTAAPTITGVVLRTPSTATVGLRLAGHVVDVSLMRLSGSWKITGTQIVGSTS